MSAPRDYAEFLKEMLLESEMAQQFLAGVEYDEFVENPEKERAVSRSLEIIGEAARSIPQAIRQKYDEVEWREIIGMRDRLVHGYRVVSLTIVWDTVKFNLPIL